jgi:amino acid transporter
MKLTKKYLLVGMLGLIVFALPLAVSAQVMNEGIPELLEQTQLGNRPLTETIALIIKIVLSFLGLIAVIIIIMGGFKWMTSGGNESKVEEAKKLMIAGIIGLAIVILAYAIANFIIGRLIEIGGTE